MRSILAILLAVALLSSGVSVSTAVAGCCGEPDALANADAGCCCSGESHSQAGGCCGSAPVDNDSLSRNSGDDSCPVDTNCPCSPAGCCCHPAVVLATLPPLVSLASVPVLSDVWCPEEWHECHRDAPPLPPPRSRA